MAGRRSFWKRLTSRFRPKTERRRASRQFGGKLPSQPINPNLPQFGARERFGARAPFGPTGQEPRDREDYRDIYEDEGSQGNFDRLYSFFNNLPAIYENEDEREDVWRSFLRFSEPGGTKRNSPRNPFWSDLGLHPSDFDWEGWRTAMGY